MREIRDLKLKSELEKIDPELKSLILIKDDGYFWIASPDSKWAARISQFYFNEILINDYNQLTIKEWVREIINVLIQSRWDVHEEMLDWQVDLKLKAINAGY